MTKIKKTYAAIFLFVFLNTALTPSAHAVVGWGEALGAAFWKQATEEMVKSIYDTTLANLKIAGIRILQAKLFQALGMQDSSGPGLAGLIISDWKMFIYGSAMKYSDQMTTDFFRGLSSGAAGGMQQRVINPARMAVQKDLASMRPDLQNYVPNGDASLIFQAGKSMNPWVAWRKAAEPQNDLAFWTVVGMGVKESAYEQEKQAKISAGESGGGIIGKEQKVNQPPAREAIASNGKAVSVPAGSDYKGQKITTPGSMIQNTINEIQMMPVRVLSMAQRIPEVVTAMANQVISQMIQQGATNMISGSSSGGGGNSSAMMGQQIQAQTQMMVQSGVRTMASPNMFFGR